MTHFLLSISFADFCYLLIPVIILGILSSILLFTKFIRLNFIVLVLFACVSFFVIGISTLDSFFSLPATYIQQLPQPQQIMINAYNKNHVPLSIEKWLYLNYFKTVNHQSNIYLRLTKAYFYKEPYFKYFK